jgi:hypothetical protein
MEGISEIRITGIDETRPPRIRKAPYIDLYFRLSHKAPKAWCENYNQLLEKKKYPIKIHPEEGLFIETWVRKPEEIPALVDLLKSTVTACSEQYIARIEAEALAAAAKSGVKLGDEGEQGRLNRIIAELNFDD